MAALLHGPVTSAILSEFPFKSGREEGIGS